MRWLKALWALVVSVVLLAGVPLLLFHTIGNPLAGAEQIFTTATMTDTGVLDVLAVIVCGAAAVAWLQFTAAFLVEFRAVRRAVRHGHRPAGPRRVPLVFGGQQRLAHTLVCALLLLGPALLSAIGPTVTAVAAAPPAAVASARDWTSPTAAHPAADSQAQAFGPFAHEGRAATAVKARAANTATVTLTKDGPRNWWDLAQQHLGAGDRWPQLWALNQGHQQADGTVLSSPNTLLRVGWQITVPATAATPAAATPAAPASTAAAAAAPAGRMVTVQPGDSLSELATTHGMTWTTLWQANQNRPQIGGAVFTDPNYLEPGWTLILPIAETAPAAAAGSVTVAPGVTLSQIAVDHGSTTDALWQANHDRTEPDGDHFSDPNYLEPGWVIQIPAPHTTMAGQPAGPNHVRQQAEQARQRAATEHKMAAQQAEQARQRAATEHKMAAQQAEQARQRAAAEHKMAAQQAEQARQRTAAEQQAAQRRAAELHAAAGQQAAGGTPAGRETEQAAPVTSGPGSASSSASSGTESASSSASSEVSMLAAGGGAVLLTALGLAALLRARRRQFRMRRAGRSMASTPAEGARMERLLLTAGTRGLADVTWLDQALRSLVQGLSKVPGAQLPDVVAVRLGTADLELVLAAPMLVAPSPWSVQESGLRWRLARSDELAYDEAERELHIPPYPLLVSVGYTPAGDHYLIDLERIGSLSLSGDQDRCLNLARFIAAEVAHNQWSELLGVTLVGFGQEMARMNPEQLRYAPDLGRVLTAVKARLAGVDEVMAATGVDVATGRLQCVAGDTWAPHVLLIAPDAAADEAGLAALLQVLNTTQDRLTIAVVLAQDNPAVPEVTRWHLHLDADGMLSIPAMELELVAEQLPEHEAAQMAQLLAAAAVEQDQPTPPDDGDEPWQAFADLAGNLRPEATTTAPTLRVAGTWPARPNSILPLPAQQYAAKAATTEQDVAMLAPGVSDRVQTELTDSDPTLDEDLAAWLDPDNTQVKLRLLGPLQVWAAGLDPAPAGLPQKVEAVAYLATRARGASAAQCREDLWPADRSDKPTSKVRNLLHGTRSWLGVNPQDGREYIPANLGEGRGGLYLIEGIVTDADLFRRLRLRALARGTAGLENLQAALDLVTGQPFEQAPTRRLRLGRQHRPGLRLHRHDRRCGAPAGHSPPGRGRAGTRGRRSAGGAAGGVGRRRGAPGPGRRSSRPRRRGQRRRIRQEDHAEPLREGRGRHPAPHV